MCILYGRICFLLAGRWVLPVGGYCMVIRCIFPTRIVCDVVDKVAQVDDIREGRL